MTDDPTAERFAHDELTNTFKRRLAWPDRQFGIFSAIADPVVTELLAGAGFDWINIDFEHTTNNLASLLHQLQAIAAYDTSVMVRPHVGDPAVISRRLDVGVQTLLVPKVESAEQAARLVQAARYPPAGDRGVGGSLARASRWQRISDYYHRADEELCLIAQIESVTAVTSIEDIAAVEGIDALFVGPSDLAASMGFIGRTDHPDVVAVVDESTRRIRAAGKPAGVFAVGTEAVQRACDAGANFVAIGSDTSAFATATTALARSFIHRT